MNLFSSLILTINSLSLSMILFLFKNEKSLIPPFIEIEHKTLYSILLVIVIISILHYIGKYLILSDEDEEIKEGTIENIDYANYQFLPSFFVIFFYCYDY